MIEIFAYDHVEGLETSIRNFPPSSLTVIDNTNLHKKHKNFQTGKLHLKIILKSENLKKLNTIDANRKIFSSLKEYMAKYIHSLQIKIE